MQRVNSIPSWMMEPGRVWAAWCELGCGNIQRVWGRKAMRSPPHASHTQGFLFSFITCLFRTSFSRTFHMLTTCVAWSQHPRDSYVSLLPTKRRASDICYLFCLYSFLDSQLILFFSALPSGPRGSPRRGMRKLWLGLGKKRLRWSHVFWMLGSRWEPFLLETEVVLIVPLLCNKPP